MPTHRVKLLKREEVAEGTMSFYFEKPADFRFKPGQYLDCSLIDPPQTDTEGNIRTFSIASAPAESDLMVATRMRDTAFKRVLKGMPLGSHLNIDGPLGSFTMHSNVSRAAVFLAGGIGITPFRSMIVNTTRNGSPIAWCCSVRTDGLKMRLFSRSFRRSEVRTEIAVSFAL